MVALRQYRRGAIGIGLFHEAGNLVDALGAGIAHLGVAITGFRASGVMLKVTGHPCATSGKARAMASLKAGRSAVVWNRECLALPVGRKLSSEDVLAALAELLSHADHRPTYARTTAPSS